MPKGLNNSGDFRSGTKGQTSTQVNWTPDPKEFGNPINSSTKDFGNQVTWSPSPAHFGNKVGGTPAVPTFDPPAGTYHVPQVVHIISDGADAIYYTLDGTAPTTASFLYQGSVFIPSSMTVKAIAVVNGVASSAGTAAYVIS